MINHYFGVSATLDELTSLDLQDEIHLLPGRPVEIIRFDFGTLMPSGRVEWVAQKGEAVFFPNLGRGGVNTGGNSVWSDADNLNDLMERVLGIKGKDVSA